MAKRIFGLVRVRRPSGRALLLALAIVAAGLDGAHAEAIWNPSAAAKYSHRQGGTALIIRRRGQPDVAFYEPGYNARTPVPVFSITKSLTALACLSQPEASLGDVVRGSDRDALPVTLRHLLSQTSGISCGYDRLYKKSLLDVRKAAAALPSEAAPGARFAYGPSHYEFLGTVLAPTGGAPDGAERALDGFLGRVGIHPSDWRTDRRGHRYLSAGAVLTPEDLLKIGNLILARGRLFPFRVIVPPNRLAAALTGSPANPAYGLGFWLNRAAAVGADQRDIEAAISAHLTRDEWSRMCLSKSAPADLVCMAGSGGQRVYVIPSLGAVVVRVGRPAHFQDPAFLAALFSR